jgi:hypothetical protein
MLVVAGIAVCKSRRHPKPNKPLNRTFDKAAQPGCARTCRFVKRPLTLALGFLLKKARYSKFIVGFEGRWNCLPVSETVIDASAKIVVGESNVRCTRGGCRIVVTSGKSCALEVGR